MEVEAQLARLARVTLAATRPEGSGSDSALWNRIADLPLPRSPGWRLDAKVSQADADQKRSRRVKSQAWTQTGQWEAAKERGRHFRLRGKRWSLGAKPPVNSKSQLPERPSGLEVSTSGFGGHEHWSVYCCWVVGMPKGFRDLGQQEFQVLAGLRILAGLILLPKQ